MARQENDDLIDEIGEVLTGMHVSRKAIGAVTHGLDKSSRRPTGDGITTGGGAPMGGFSDDAPTTPENGEEIGDIQVHTAGLKIDSTDLDIVSLHLGKGKVEVIDVDSGKRHFEVIDIKDGDKEKVIVVDPGAQEPGKRHHSTGHHPGRRHGHDGSSPGADPPKDADVPLVSGTPAEEPVQHGHRLFKLADPPDAGGHPGPTPPDGGGDPSMPPANAAFGTPFQPVGGGNAPGPVPSSVPLMPTLSTSLPPQPGGGDGKPGAAPPDDGGHKLARSAAPGPPPADGGDDHGKGDTESPEKRQQKAANQGNDVPGNGKITKIDIFYLNQVEKKLRDLADQVRNSPERHLLVDFEGDGTPYSDTSKPTLSSPPPSPPPSDGTANTGDTKLLVGNELWGPAKRFKTAFDKTAGDLVNHMNWLSGFLERIADDIADQAQNFSDAEQHNGMTAQDLAGMFSNVPEIGDSQVPGASDPAALLNNILKNPLS